MQKPLDRPDGEVKLIVAWLLALSHAALRAVSMFSTTLCDSNLFFWLTLVSVVIFFKRPSTGKHSLTIWEYFLTGVEVRKKKDSNSAIVSKAPRWKILKCQNQMDVSCFVVYYVFVVVVFSGYLYAHISYLDDNCPACLLLLSTDRDAFFELAETRLKTVEVSCIS